MTDYYTVTGLNCLPCVVAVPFLRGPDLIRLARMWMAPARLEGGKCPLVHSLAHCYAFAKCLSIGVLELNLFSIRPLQMS